MLSVGSSNEGRSRSGLGFEERGGERRREMEVNELEEGEAYSGQEDDIDPDALSYIDEKLQHVLGHFQKEFEGGVSAETLGAKFGGYGSFLPTYQRSPPILLPQPKSPVKVPVHSLLRSPCNLQPEISCQNASVLANASIPKANNASVAQPTDKSGKRDTCISSCSMEGIMQLESTRQTMDGRDPKSLKVRIKVGPDSVLIRNKPEIYSDLGLDVSPSPSLEDSPGGSRELSPESPDSFCESPSTILQIMTCFPVPGGYLLSPLSATPLHLFEKEGISIKNFKKSMPHKVVSENCSASSDTSLRAKDVRDFTCKEKKSREKGRKLVQAHGVTCEDVITMPLNNEIGCKTPAVQKFVLSAQDMALSFSAQSVDAKDETYVGGNSIKKCSKMFDIRNEPSKILMMEEVNALDLRKDNHLELTDNMRMDDNSDKETSPLKRKAYSKTHFTEKALEEANGKFDICSKYKSKSQKNLDKKKADSGKYRMRKDYTASFEEHVREQPAQKTCSSEKNVFKLVLARDQTFEDGGIDIKGSQNNGALLVEPNKEKPSTVLSVAPKGIKKMSHVKDAHLENKSKLSKLQKDLNKGHNTESQSELLISVQAKRVENMRHVLGSSRSTEKSKERSEVNKVEHFRNTEPANDAPAPMNDAVPNNNSVSTSPGLVLIEDNWVCCDICQRWRLLPYGTNPETLPKKWQCSMQVWLPGLNNCNVSQDETTKTFHELFQFPAPGSEPNLTAHLNAAASSKTSADTLNPGRRLENVMHNAPLSGKKKHGSLDATDLPNDSALTHLSNYSKNLLASSGHKDFNDAGYCMGMDSLIKPKPGLTGRSMDTAAEKHIHKQKDKHKTASSLKVGGDLTERLAKYSKPTIKRGTDVDGHRTSKKLKKDGSYHSTKDFPSHIDLSDKMAVDGDTEYLAKVSRNTLQNCSNYSHSKDLKSKNASSRKSREQVNSSNGKHKEISSASEAEKFDKYDSNDRKRKLKERQVSQACQEISMSNEQVTGSRPMLKESLIESELRRQKKAKVAKSEGKAFRADVGGGNFEMKDCSTRIALSSNRNHPPNIIDNEGVRPATDEKIVHYQGNATSGLTLDCIDSLKRDVTYMRSLAEATSSSSKISGSQKGKVNLPEARGSPVESVSSSPMRILNNDNNSVRRNSCIKDNVISMAYSGMGSPKRFSDGELDGSSDQSGTRVKDPASNDCLISSEIYRSADSGVMDSLKGSHDYQDTETNCFTGVKSIDVKYSKTVKREDVIPTDPGKSKILCGNGNVPHQPEKYHLERSDNNHTFDEDEHCTLGQKNSAKSSIHPKDKRRNSNFDSDKGKIKVIVSSADKDSHSVRTCNTSHTDADFNHLNSSKKDDLESHSKQHKNHDLRDAVVGVSRSKPAPQQNLQKASSHENQNPPGLLISESTDRSTVVFRKGVQSCNTAIDKLEKKVCGPQTAPESIKGTNLEQYSVDAVNSEASKSTKPSRKFDEQNGTLPNLLRQSATSVPGSSSPMKKDGHPSVNALIKEARDLKHTANRLKSVGLEDESSGIFFESSLKFLHAASLLEPANAENARQGELVPSNQMILMYYETAKFCEFCAHEFERLKEMVAAALAYKCAEVAYLKVAYYKHPSASKDRLELQVALDAPLPGESPSSSASDIDNLNNQVGLDKVASARAVSSPQIAGNHAIASRNRPHVMRLLTYTNYLNCAFEATKKSQNAIAAASTDLGKNGIDVHSASKVLDFNFHNVEGLLRLVRLSMNSIGH